MEDYIHDFYLELAPAMTVVSTEYQQSFPLGDGKYGFLFVVYNHDPRTRLLKGSIRTPEDFQRAFSTGAKVVVINKENDKQLVEGEIETFGGSAESPDPIIKGFSIAKRCIVFVFGNGV